MKFIIVVLGTVVAFAACSPTPLFKDFSDGYNQFSADVYKEMSKSHPGNFLVCPLSVETLLALAHAGAKGPTAKQITTTLHLPDNSQTVQEIFQRLSPKLQGNEDYELSNANKIYVKDDFQISDAFKSAAQNSFQSEIESIDFESKAEAASRMNQWVEEKTHHKIKNLVDEGDLNEDTRAVLINALYFHGKWITQFDESLTAQKTFHVSDQKTSEVHMMEVTNDFKYYESPELNAKFLEMPYKGDDVTMTIVLPNEIGGLSRLEENIGHVLKEPSYKTLEVHVQIPKFKTESKIDFKDILQKLGIKDAFENSADFTDIGAAGDLLKISKVIQKTFIELEEKGTKAAAATAVFVEFIRSSLPSFPPVEFNANHPFIYYLKSPAGILFIGRFVKA